MFLQIKRGYIPARYYKTNIIYFEKRDVIILYSQILKTNVSFNDAENILKIMIVEYPYFEETFFAMIKFFDLCEKYIPKDMLKIYEIFDNIYEYFEDSEYMNFIIRRIAFYLLRLPIDSGDVNFINFSCTIIDFLKKENQINQNLIIKLQKKRQINIIKIVQDSATSGQIIFVLKQCNYFIYDENVDQEIISICLMFIIKSYYAIGSMPLCQKYIRMLKKQSYHYFKKLPRHIKKLVK